MLQSTQESDGKLGKIQISCTGPTASDSKALGNLGICIFNTDENATWRVLFRWFVDYT